MKNWIFGFLLLALAAPSYAGVFNTSHYLPTGDFNLGIEPDLTLTSGAGLAGNVRFGYGLNDLMNVNAIIGTGGGPRGFRIGGNTTFDFFPDMEGQPGIGIAAQAVYYRLPEAGQLELTGIPYIHKAFISGKSEIEPFLALPIGVAFTEGRYKAISNIAIGSMFKSNEKLRYVMEFGVAINNTDSYVAGGIVYYH